MVAAFDVAKPCAFDDAWAAAFGVVAVALAVDAGDSILVTVTAAVDVDTFCTAAAFGFVVVFVLATAAAVDVDKFCTAGAFGFVFATGGFAGGVEGVGLMAEAVPQTLAMVNAARARAMGMSDAFSGLRFCSQVSASNLSDQDLNDPETANRMPCGI